MSARRIIGGIGTAIRGPIALVGWAIILSKPILRLIDRFSEMDFVATYWPIVRAFLDTGVGTLVSIVAGTSIVGYSIIHAFHAPSITSNLESGADRQYQLDKYSHILSLEGLNIIVDRTNPVIDLSLGMRIKNSWDGPTRFMFERSYVEFNGKKGRSDPLLNEDVVIGRMGECLFSYRSVADIEKNTEEMVYVRFHYTIIYGPAGDKFRRRWTHILSFSFKPREYGRARFSTVSLSG